MPDWLTAILQWLLDALLWLPRKVWQLLLEGLASVINAIPVPDFITNLGPTWAALGSGTMYFLDVIQFDVGFPMLLSAYFIRFIIRRLPVVG